MSESVLDVNKIIVTRQNSGAPSAAAPSSLDYGELAVDINGVLRTGNKNGQVVTHIVSTDSRLTDTRNPKVTTLTNQNLNDITTPGFYYAGGNNTVVNKPSGVDSFGLLVERTASGFFAQTLTSSNVMNGKIFFRQISSGTTWTAWSNFYTTTYKPTLSELGAAAASHTHTKSQITDFPTSLKNPTSIKIQLNSGTTEGTNQFTYDGSAAKNINITPSSIGASASGHTHSYLPLSGGTMTGAITLPGNPTSNLHAATKQYVDSQIAGSGSGDMLKSVYDTDNDGVVDKAEKLGAARTIGLGEAVVSTATSFDGSQNITIPVTSVRESYLTWGDRSLAGSITPIDSALADFASGNRLFGTPASSISVEVSRNGGSTWSAYPGVTDGGKRSLVSTGTSFTLGGVGSGNTTQDQLRVTISAGSFYFFCRKVLMNISTNGATGVKVAVKYSTIGAPDTFKDYGAYTLSGWSGWNSIPLSMSWGGGSNQTGQTKKVQFTFTMTGAGPAAVLAIYAYGENAWSFPNIMAKYGRSYDVDYDCNSTFRGKVTLKQDPSSNLEAATKQYVDNQVADKGDMKKATYDTNNNGIVDKAETLATARTINGTSFNGSANITTAKWGIARNITIGDTKKSVNGSSDITWSLGEIGAAVVDPNSSFSGAARAATRLATARTLTIGKTGKSFNGSANVGWNFDEIGVLRTYTSISELGYNAATTIQNLYSKMTDKSQLIITDENITNPPQVGCIIVIVKYSSGYGYAEAYSREEYTKYIMYNSGGGLTGTWVDIQEKANKAILYQGDYPNNTNPAEVGQGIWYVTPDHKPNPFPDDWNNYGTFTHVGNAIYYIDVFGKLIIWDNYYKKWRKINIEEVSDGTKSIIYEGELVLDNLMPGIYTVHGNSDAPDGSWWVIIHQNWGGTGFDLAFSLTNDHTPKTRYWGSGVKGQWANLKLS